MGADWEVVAADRGRSQSTKANRRWLRPTEGDCGPGLIGGDCGPGLIGGGCSRLSQSEAD